MKLWTTRRIAAALKASESTIVRTIKSQGIEVQTINRSKKVRHSVLVEWLGFDPSTDRVWTVAEITQETGLTIAMVKRSLRSGKLASIKVCSKLRRVRHSELKRWLGYDPLLEAALVQPSQRASTMLMKREMPKQGWLFER